MVLQAYQMMVPLVTLIEVHLDPGLLWLWSPGPKSGGSPRPLGSLGPPSPPRPARPQDLPAFSFMIPGGFIMDQSIATMNQSVLQLLMAKKYLIHSYRCRQGKVKQHSWYSLML